MHAHDFVAVGEAALVLYSDGELPVEQGDGRSELLTVNIHLDVDKVIIYRQHNEDAEDGSVYVADFVRFEEDEAADGFRVRFANIDKVGEAGANWFRFSGRSNTAPFHIQPNP